MIDPPRDPSSLLDEMRTYYDRRAPVYDSSMGYDDPPTVRSLGPVVDVLREAMRGRSVLEVACGPGFWTSHVVPVVQSIVATDINDSTLAEARAKRLDASRISFVRADAYDLPEFSERFDGAFAVDFLAHVPLSRLSLFLDGLGARLAPRARVAFCDQTPGPHSITGVRDAEGNPLQERELPDGSRYRVIKHFFSDDEYRAMLARRADAIEIHRFPDVRRVVATWTLMSV